jgi:hypothetical protein
MLQLGGEVFEGTQEKTNRNDAPTFYGCEANDLVTDGESSRVSRDCAWQRQKETRKLSPT